MIRFYFGGKREFVPTFYHGTIHHNGTTQHIQWIGPIMVIVRNRKSARAILSARVARELGV